MAPSFDTDAEAVEAFAGHLEQLARLSRSGRAEVNPGDLYVHRFRMCPDGHGNPNGREWPCVQLNRLTSGEVDGASSSDIVLALGCSDCGGLKLTRSGRCSACWRQADKRLDAAERKYGAFI